MVRLEFGQVPQGGGSGVSFQFLNGAIRIKTELAAFKAEMNFNSSMVRLECEGVIFTVTQYDISIPQWCD